jgi:hypothetical protein
MRRLGLTALAVTAILGLPMLILQRWVAETRGAAIVLVLGWFVAVGIGLAVAVWRRPELRLPAGATYVAILAGTLVVGYLTGFRDVRVDEDVAIAAARASGAERSRALRGDTGEAGPTRRTLELARGSFMGADGHAGRGRATVLGRAGKRLLSFTEFDVDPGVDVDVLLSASPDGIDDAVEVGNLKGNVGDQQYPIPEAVDLRRYSSVVLWCNPFTVRIAVAELDV